MKKYYKISIFNQGSFSGYVCNGSYLHEEEFTLDDAKRFIESIDSNYKQNYKLIEIK